MIKVQIIESDICYCLKFLLIPLHYLCLFMDPSKTNGFKSNVIFKISKLLLALTSGLFGIRFLANLFYNNSNEVMNFGFACENLRATMSCTANALTFYWIMKQEKMIYQLISMANQFYYQLNTSIKKQLRNKIIKKSIVLSTLGLVRLVFFYSSTSNWDTKYYFNRLLFNVQFKNDLIGKLVMGIDYTMFWILCELKLFLILFYISLCYFINTKMEQFNETIENLNGKTLTKCEKRILIMKKLVKLHSSMIVMIKHLELTFSKLATLWLFDFLFASFYYLPLVAKQFGHQIKPDGISKAIELWFHLYLLISLNLSMSDINLSLKNKASSFYIYYCTFNPSNTDERHYCNLLLNNLKHPVTALTGSHYITPSRELLLKAISLLLTYGVLMYQVFPELFKSKDDWAG